MNWQFVVPGVQSKQRPRHGARGTYTPKRTANYEQIVAAMAMQAGVRVGQGPCSVQCDVYTKDKRRRDLDNVLKAILDGLQKAGPLVLADDCASVVREMGARWCGVDRDAPRVEVTVQLIEPVLGAGVGR
jgi:Holliday junction resolvase RusA-like endonuclease